MTSDAAVARPAATVLLLRDRPGLQVLMVQRARGAVFGSALVFPGGKLESHDGADDWLPHILAPADLDPEERALRIACWREAYEETGLLAAGGALGADVPAGASFLDRVKAGGGRLDLGALTPLARWITPVFAKARFDTRFYLARLDDGEAVCDGMETVWAQWLAPAEALALGESGERKLLLPTRANLRWLAGHGSAAEALARAAASGPMGPVQPRRETAADGAYLVLPEGLGYPPTRERLPSQFQ
jgi:8-oxo-dGTP pyrophosphatase MutT (NUDIX family)